MKSVDEGIFLHRISYSDSSLIASFYTRKGGLQKFIFRGGKKKAHQLYPLSVSELNFYGRADSELLNLTSVESIENFEFQFDPAKSTIAFFIAETIRKCVAENDADPATYAFLHSEICRLNECVESTMFPIEFLVYFTEIIGIQPLVTPGVNSFDLDEGIIGNVTNPMNRVEKGDHVLLISSVTAGNAFGGRVTRELREKALETLMLYYTIHIPRLKSFGTYDIVREILSA